MFKKTMIATSVAIVTAGLLTACNPSDQDQGSTAIINIGGKAIDGYIAYARVYIDTNNNQKLDAWEPRAFTDKDGYFSTSKSGLNYCGLETTDVRYGHCLKSTATVPEGSVLRFIGGYDISTGEKFEGSMAAQVTLDSSGQVEAKVSTPLTSFFFVDEAVGQKLINFLIENYNWSADTTYAAALENYKSYLANQLSVTTDDLMTDFYAGIQDGGTLSATDAKLVATALTLHKAADIIGDALEVAYPSLYDEDQGGTRDAAADTYMVLQGMALYETSVYNNQTAFLGLWDATNPSGVPSFFVTLFNFYMGLNTPEPSKVTAAVNRAMALRAIIDNNITTGMTLNEVYAVARSAELLAKQSKSTDPATDMSGDFAAVSTALSDPAYVTAMGQDGLNVSILSENFNSSTFGSSSATAATTTDQFPAVEGAKLDFSAELGLDRVVFYLHAPTQEGVVNAGKIDACLKYTSKGQSSSYYTTGSHFTGRWELLTNTSMLLTLNIAGGEESLKATLLSKSGTGPYTWTYRFDLDDDSTTQWSGSTASENFDIFLDNEVPTDDDGCVL